MLGQQMADQRFQIVWPLAERGNEHFDDVDPIQQIVAEASFRDQRGQITMRGGNDPCVGRHWRQSPDRMHFFLLQDAQEFPLEGRRQIADLVEEDRSVAAPTETSRACPRTRR